LSADWVSSHTEAIRSLLAREAKEGEPSQQEAEVLRDQDDYIGNTTHLSVIDKFGNMVALTQTINDFFGSAVVVPEHGIIMNNEMYDFTFEADHVNAPAPGKRPRSNMAPMLVMKDGKPVATLGTPGGRRIPSALVQIIVRSIDFDHPLQEAIDAPRLYVDAAAGRIAYEPGLGEETMEQVVEILAREKEWELQQRSELDNYFGGAQGIWVRQTDSEIRLEGAADPRRNGAVARTSVEGQDSGEAF
jgi:gamma-glutamyltranspeptidase / glutathione hydrolase